MELNTTKPGCLVLTFCCECNQNDYVSPTVQSEMIRLHAPHSTTCSLQLKAVKWSLESFWLLVKTRIEAVRHDSNCHLSAVQMFCNNTQLYIVNGVARWWSWLSGWWDRPAVAQYRGLMEGSTLGRLAARAWNMLWNPHLVIRMCK